MKFLIRKQSSINCGFSLIELMVSIFVISLIGISVGGLQKSIFSMNRFFADTLSAQQEARTALKIMSAEIRTAGKSSVGSFPIVPPATATSFIFYSNIDNDSLKERVRYFLDGSMLKKGVIKPTGNPLTYNIANEVITTLMRNIVNGATPVFTYYDTNYDGTTPPIGDPVDVNAVRLVKVTFMIDKDIPQPPSALTIITQISLRNLKSN